MRNRQFAVVVEVWGLETGDLPKATECVIRCVTDEGASIETDTIQQRATCNEKQVPAGLRDLVQDSPGRRLQVRIPFTATEFVDFGFEVLMCAVRVCRSPEQHGHALMERLSVGGVLAQGCMAKLMWRDDGNDNWTDAAFSRGLHVDVMIDALPDDPAAEQQSQS